MPLIPPAARTAALSTTKMVLARAGRPVRFSHFGEEEVISRLLSTYPPPARICVDLGAADGVEGSNTLPLYRDGWTGLAAEYDRRRFAFLAGVHSGTAGIGLARCKVTPDTVVPLLRAHGIPKRFGFLNLDIDGYDHFVLDALLHEFRPALMCVEINESFPPPLRFTIKWDPDWSFAGDDHLFGQSICALGEVATRHGYAFVELLYNNALLVEADRAGDAALTAEQAYRRGYLERADRLERLPWNAKMEPLQGMDVDAARTFVASRFPGREASYELW